MAKKLNKKVAAIGIVLLVLVVIGGAGLAVRYFYHRNPDLNLDLARQALAEDDYQRAERLLSRAYRFGKTDAYKIERLFELADLHLIHNELHEANWDKALRCWNTVVNIDPGHLEAHRRILNYFYEMADSGTVAAWRNVHDRATKLVELIEQTGEPVDTELQMGLGRSALAIARRGGTGTAERSTYLNQAIDIFETLIQREPTTPSHYTYLAEAMQLQGELNAQIGVMNARENARREAVRRLDEAVEKADNTAEALAARYLFEIQTIGNDPNRVESLRAELEEHVRTLEPDAKLLTVLSQAYELPGKANAEAELNRSIEAARQAKQLEPDEFEYAYRLAMLLYRKGSAFQDAAAMDDALMLAEEMKSMAQAQPTPGPRQARNLAYRNTLNTFLARCYLEKALDHPDDAQPWIRKAEPVVEQISQYFGSSEHAAVQQWEGILALAKGERDRGIRLLYRAYEQSKALDSANQPSSIDPVLCVVLARVAKEENLIGLQREFLEKALTNRVRIVLDKPSLILDYADIMTRLQAWNQAVSYAGIYQQRYGPTPRSQKIITEAALALGDETHLTQAVAALDEGSVEQKLLELRFIGSRITQISRRFAQRQQEQDQPPQMPDDVRQELADYRVRQKQILLDLVEAAPDQIEASQLQSVCGYFLQNEMTAEAVELLDAYLDRRPDALTLQILRRQAEEPNPLSIPRQRYEAIQEDAVAGLSDPVQRATAMADLLRSRGAYDQALEILSQAAETAQDNSEIIAEQFEIALESENVEMAEQLLRVIRTRNLDGCEGNLAAARLELMKSNYSLALRRVDECLTIKPLMSMGYYLKSRIFEQMDDLDAAIENSRQAMQMDTLNGLYAKHHASLLFNRNVELGSRLTVEQQNELIQSITTAMFLNPNDGQLQSVYAEVISNQAPDRALAMRQQILRQHPSVANAVMLGNMALRIAQSEDDAIKKSGLIELAGKAFTQAIELDPNSESAKAAYADYLNRTQQSEKAEALLRDDSHLLWRFYLQNGQFEKAQEILLQLHQDTPDDTSVLRGLVLAAEGLGDRTVQKQYLDLLAAEDNDKDEQLWLIQKYLDGGFAEEGGRLLASVKERYPDEKLTILMDAWLRMTNGQLREALTLTDRYLDIDGNNAGAWRLRGRLYRLLNEPRRAVDDLQRSKSLSANPAVSMELAAVFSEMGQIDAAVGELVNALQQPQAPLQIRLMLELLYQRNNRLNDLERFYTRTIERYPDTPLWSMRAGRFYLSRQDAARAVNYLKQAWEIHRRHDSRDPVALNLYLEAMNQNKQYTEVINTASQWVDGPLAPVAYAQMAQAHFHQGQIDRAESLFFSALDKGGAADWFQDTVLSLMLNTVGMESAVRWTQQNPDALPSLLLSYRLAQLNEQFNRGIELIDRCLAETSPDQPNWGNLSLKKANLLVQAYMKTADADYMNRAIELFGQVLGHYPENPSILNNLAYLLAVNDQQLELAMQYARRAHQRDPGNPVYLDTYAYTQYKNGRSESARENLLRALQLYEASREPVPWDVYNHLGLVHESLGETAQAIDNFRKALETASDVPEKERKRIEERIDILKQQANTSI